ncbi:thioredoxin family protein [Niastella caeni]|uniref:Thioredoxin family protein n=1 Tax=Niastella caeni TaxID=2569763 RepID=A0A4S8HWT0_9BACT|nr:thioredoxin family protein [Niastella caeni]THU40090.1 thioredoxin family protein [Niastella caeni]
MQSTHITVIAMFIFVITACTPKMTSQASQPENVEATDKKGNLILLGKSTRQRLAQPPFDTWFNKNYSDYTIDSITAIQIKPLLQNKQFVLFMGTWCGDSRREVPRMYRILDHCGVKPSQVQLVNLSNSDTAYKQSPGHEERGLNIRRVPTLLIYENRQEVGRVVESPVVTLEKDILAIVTKQPYEHRYKHLMAAQPVNKADSTRSQQTNRQ